MLTILLARKSDGERFLSHLSQKVALDVVLLNVNRSVGKTGLKPLSINEVYSLFML